MAHGPGEDCSHRPGRRNQRSADLRLGPRQAGLQAGPGIPLTSGTWLERSRGASPLGDTRASPQPGACPLVLDAAVHADVMLRCFSRGGKPLALAQTVHHVGRARSMPGASLRNAPEIFIVKNVPTPPPSVHGQVESGEGGCLPEKQGVLVKQTQSDFKSTERVFY